MGTFRTTRGLHNKPLGCGASGAYALGPDEKEEEREVIVFRIVSDQSVVSRLFPQQI